MNDDMEDLRRTGALVQKAELVGIPPLNGACNAEFSRAEYRRVDPITLFRFATESRHYGMHNSV